MSHEIFMPALSSTMTEGKIVEWLKNPGDKVERGESVLVVESDKADMDVESFQDGYLAAVLMPAGSTAPVGETIGIIVENENEIASVQAENKNISAVKDKQEKIEVADEVDIQSTKEVERVKPLLPLIKKKKILAISHITGGGIYENLERVIPDEMLALIDCQNFIIPERFVWLKELAKINTKEMLRTFNCGIGLIIIINHKDKKAVFNYLRRKKINSYVMGEVITKKSYEKKVSIKSFGKWDLT